MPRLLKACRRRVVPCERPRRLLRARGRGAASLPSSAFQFARTDDQRQRHMYFKIARSLWLDGTFQDLPGPATIMLLILLAEQADKKDV
jgi:hypothetical protein